MSLVKFILTFTLFAIISASASAQFGKLYQSEDFRFHFNDCSIEQLHFLDSTLALELVDLQKRINYYTNNSLDILVYESKAFTRTKGNHLISKGKEGKVLLQRGQVSLSLNQSLPDIVKDFRFQVIKILVDEMMYGGSFQDRIKSANLINLPEWVLPGLYHYVGYEWDAATDNEMRYIHYKYGLARFNNIPKEHNAVKGASFWKYLEFTYGEFAIPNLLYMARRSPKFNGAIIFAFQVNTADVYLGWEKYFRQAYDSDRNRTNPVKGIELDKSKLIDVHLLNSKQLVTLEKTPFGYALFRTELDSDNKVRLYALPKEEQVLTAFSNCITSSRDTIILLTYTDNKSKLTYMHSGKVRCNYLEQLLSSIHGNDQSLYYSVSSYDSSEIHSIKEGEIFRIPGYINSFDVYRDHISIISEKGFNSSLDLYQQSLDTFSEVYSSTSKLRQVIFGDRNHLLFNSQESGIWNGKLLTLGNSEVQPVTNYRSNILFHQYTDSIFIEYLDQSNASSLYKSEPLGIGDFYIYDTIYPTVFHKRDKQRNQTSTVSDTARINPIASYSFQSPINSNYDFTSDNYDSLQSEGEEFFVLELTRENRHREYSPQSAYLSLTNKPFITNSTGFIDNAPLLTPNRVNISLGGSLSDTYNKNSLKIGVLGLLQAGARDLDFQYVRRGKQQLDIRFLSRRRILFQQDLRNGYRTNLVEAKITKHLAKNIYLTNGFTFRNERFDPYIFNEASFLDESEERWILSGKTTASYQHQTAKNLLAIELNLETMVELQSQTYNVASLFSSKFRSNLTSKLHYLGSLKAGTSQGSSPIYYLLGGSSNDLLAEFEDRPFSSAWNPSLYQPIFGVRGFSVNYRNGNTFLAHSSQLGIQPLDYLFARPIASEVFSNLIIHTFIDIGTIFYGSSIYDSPNVLNTTQINSRNGGIRIERRAFKNPLIFSTGLGLSTKVYGYKVSLDYAFGYEDQKFQIPMWHIGLGQPF